MPASPPLPTKWVRDILDTLALTYGSRFASQYLGASDDMSEVVDVWAKALRYCSSAAIKFAIDNLPDKPPNAVEFKHLAQQYHPPAPPPELPPEPADPAQVQHVVACLRELQDQLTNSHRDMRAWAMRLRDAEAAGERLTNAQRAMWRAALRYEPTSEEVLP